MLLGDFIKELKHNSLWLEITDIKTSRTETIFEGTLGVLKNNIHYQERWYKYKIFEIIAEYDENMKTFFNIIIYYERNYNYDR